HAYLSAGTFTITLTVTNIRGSGNATRSVTLGPPAIKCNYSLSPQPVAHGGTLTPGQSAGFVVTVTNALGKLIKAPEPVWLSFPPATGGGTAPPRSSPPHTALHLTTPPGAV